MTIIKCDRCKEVVEDRIGTPKIEIKMFRPYEEIRETKYDLCVKCANDFARFLKREE